MAAMGNSLWLARTPLGVAIWCRECSQEIILNVYDVGTSTWAQGAASRDARHHDARAE